MGGWGVGGGGYEGKTKFVYLKWTSHLWLSIQNFIPRGKGFWSWVGGWFGLSDNFVSGLLSDASESTASICFSQTLLPDVCWALQSRVATPATKLRKLCTVPIKPLFSVPETVSLGGLWVRQGG